VDGDPLTVCHKADAAAGGILIQVGYGLADGLGNGIRDPHIVVAFPKNTVYGKGGGVNIIEIKRTAAVPDCPVLNWITDTPVYDLKSAAGQLSFKTGADVFAKMECFAASEAEIFINGQKANCEYNADTQCLWFSGSIAQNSEITIIIKNFY
jgi:hypothetical protein